MEKLLYYANEAATAHAVECVRITGLKRESFSSPAEPVAKD